MPCLFTDYVLISAKRGEHSHIIGLLYKSATDNSIYKRLAREVEHIFFNGEPYEVASFAYGLDKPVSSAADFYPLLLQWNHDGADGKFSGAAEEEPAASVNHAKNRVLLSEAPIEAVWLRLRQLQSVTLAKKMIGERAKRENVTLSNGAIASKAEGVSFTLRDASDYFNAQEVRNVSQRVLNLYYGSLAFAFAEMLASPRGPNTLSEIEVITKQGHGLYTIDGGGSGLEHLVVGIISSGFFPAWTRSVGSEVPNIPQKKPRRYEDLAGMSAGSWLTVEQLFARICASAPNFDPYRRTTVTPAHQRFSSQCQRHRAARVGSTLEADQGSNAMPIHISAVTIRMEQLGLLIDASSSAQ